MSPEIIHADEINATATENDIPEGWEKTHEEYRRPVTRMGGYYIKTFESEHFLISYVSDVINNDCVHDAVLMKVKRPDGWERSDGWERDTALGTGIVKRVKLPEDAPSFPGYDEDNKEKKHKEHEKANEDAEEAAFHLGVELMREVNAGKHEHQRYDA